MVLSPTAIDNTSEKPKDEDFNSCNNAAEDPQPYTWSNEKASQEVSEASVSFGTTEGYRAQLREKYPEFAKTSRLDDLRKTEYGYLDEQDHVYLDYTGAGLAARKQHRAHEARLSTTLFGNPHSISPTSKAATEAVEQARHRVLAHFGASADEYAVVFTHNATGAAHLVGESYTFSRGKRLVLTFDNHNSINGLREFAKRRHTPTTYVPSRTNDLRIREKDLEKALQPSTATTIANSLNCFYDHGAPRRGSAGLFAYPAQSNFSGVRHPLEWVSLAQKRGFDVLLDAAAYLPTSLLDLSPLSEVQPDFVIVSWYKLFGYPTGVGCLLARREALARLSRPWFAGGTIQAVSVGLPWHVMALGAAAFEDGTLNFQAIPDVTVGLDWLANVDINMIGTRVRCLTGWFLDRLDALHHSDGKPMIRLYGPRDTTMRGGTVSFNFLDAAGKVVDERLVSKESSEARISLRTGCFCNPGCGEDAFALKMSSLWPLIFSKTKDLDNYIRLIGLPSAGAIRVSFGIASTSEDVDYFFQWAQSTYRNRVTSSAGLPPRESC